MAHAHRVHASLLRLQEAAADGRAVGDGTKRTEILVEAETAQLHAPSVEVEAVVRGPLDRANAVAERLAFDLKGVEMWIVDVPEAWFLHGERLFPAPAACKVVGDVNGCPFARHLGSGDAHAVRHDVVFRQRHEPAAAREAEARVPAGVAAGTVGAHRDHVPAFDEVGREVHAPVHVAVRPAAHEAPVEPEHRVGHCAVARKMEFALLGDRERAAVGEGKSPAVVRERIAVPDGARARQVGVERRAVVGKGVGDAGVVGHADGLPVAVVEIRLHVGTRGLRADRATGRARRLEEVASHVVQPVDHGGDAELPHRGKRFVADEPPARSQLRAGGGRMRHTHKTTKKNETSHFTSRRGGC